MTFILGLVLFAASFVTGLSEVIVVDLKPYSPNTPKDVYKNYATLSESLTTIEVKNVGDNVGFIIIQVHTHLENVTLSYNSTLILHKYVSGTNIGLVWADDAKDAIFFVMRDNKIAKSVEIFLVITLYAENDPLPGGCNLTFENIIAPYQIIYTNHDYITVNSQPPSAYGVSCNENNIEIDMYHIFLKEYDNSTSTYFDGIEAFLTVDSIKKYGSRVTGTIDYFKYRRLYSSYVGIGEVFGIIATYKNRSSAYVPGVSYGCDISKWDDDCVGPVSEYWKYFFATFVLIGLFICFFGHKFFRFTLFMMGFSVGIILTYLIITLQGEFTTEGRLITSTVVAIFYGIAWSFFWWKFGIPLLSIHLTFLLFGALIASIVMHAGLANLYVFSNNVNFWMAFLSLVLVSVIILTVYPPYGHIFACTFLGSYAFIIVMNYYFGGTLEYIVLNTYRRIVVRGFNVAVLDPPYQFIDGLLTFIWSVLVISGMFVQWKGQLGKPPFPRHRTGPILAGVPNETSLLIPPETPSMPRYI